MTNIHWIIEKAKEFQKNIYCFIILKPLTVWITTNWKILNEIGIPEHLTCLLRKLYVGQEATVEIGHGTIELVHNWERSMSRLCIVTLLI